MVKTYVIGDIHGEFDKLKKLLQTVEFDYEKDTLISLGDVVDRGPDSYSVIEELLKIKNLIAIQGNHCESWFYALKEDRCYESMMWKHGAKQTLQSYENAGVNPMVHYEFFAKQIKYYVMQVDHQIRYYFTHGGFNRHQFFEQQWDEAVYTWDRDLWAAAVAYEESTKEYPFKIKGNPTRVFIGHTPTQMYYSDKPMTCAQITNLDTGAGKGGLLTIYDLTNNIYHQA